MKTLTEKMSAQTLAELAITGICGNVFPYLAIYALGTPHDIDIRLFVNSRILSITIATE